MPTPDEIIAAEKKRRNALRSSSTRKKRKKKAKKAKKFKNTSSMVGKGVGAGLDFFLNMQKKAVKKK